MSFSIIGLRIGIKASPVLRTCMTQKTILQRSGKKILISSSSTFRLSKSMSFNTIAIANSQSITTVWGEADALQFKQEHVCDVSVSIRDTKGE